MADNKKMFLYSYLPFILFFILGLSVLFFTLLLVIEAIFGISFYHEFISVLFVAFFGFSICVTIIISLIVSVHYYKKIDPDRKDIKGMYWRMFILMSVFANSSYYDMFYGINEKQGAFESFLRKSRDKMFFYAIEDFKL